MSTNVNPQAPVEVFYCSPEVLVEAITPDGIAKQVKAMLEADTARRRPNPANGAPRPKNIRFFA